MAVPETDARRPRADPDRDAVAFVLELGKALHRYGTPAHRLEECIVKCCRRLGLDEAEVFTTPTTIIMSFGEPAELRTRMMRVEGGEIDMGKLAAVDHLADLVIDRAITVSEGRVRLAEIIAAPRRFGRAISICSHAVTAAGLAVFFRGALGDVIAAAGIGLLLGIYAQLANRTTDQARVFELVGSAFAAFAAGVVSSLTDGVSPSLVTIAAIGLLLPGMSLTIAINELATRNMIAGTARLMTAVLVLLQLVVGVALGERVAHAVVDVHQGTAIALPEPAHWIALVASSLGFAAVVQASPRAFGWILAACVVGYIGSRTGTAWLGPEMGVMVGACALGVVVNAYARWLDRPALVVLVPSVLLLVPGSMGFRGMSSLLGHDTLTGVETLFAMLIVALSIVAGLLIANAIVSPRRAL